MTATPEPEISEQELRDALAPNYVLEKELGRGGMGAVYLARDVRLDRPVAIKFLPPEMSAREDLRARFLQETRTAASFSHPNIVPVHAVEERDRVLCFVMGYVEGETLTARVARIGPLPSADVVRLLQECAWALSYAHGRGIVHRDVKPDNILIDRASGRALITDFGIARSQNSSAGLTMVGELIGTPQYMSPEQATGEALDARSDLYSLGAVAFYALAGRLPFESATAHGFITAHVTKTAPSIGAVRPDIPPALVSSVDRLLQKDAGSRFQTGEELADALDPLRSARREIPPAIRMFQVRSSQVMRNALIFLLLAPTLSKSVKGDADQIILMFMILAAATALIFQAVSGLRELAAQGFTHDDLRNALTAIDDEAAETRARLRASPDWAQRRKRQKWISAGALAGAAALIAWGLSTRIPRLEGGFQTPMSGILATAFGGSLIVGSLIYFFAANGSAARMDRRLLRLWTGRIGRWLFGVVGRRAIRPLSAAKAVSAELGPLTIVESLPKEMRRELANVGRVVSALLQQQDDLISREARLAASETEAREGTAGVATETLDRVIAELSDAKMSAHRKREAISASLERLRLELIRLRSGLGTTADVRAEAEQASQLLETVN